MYHALPSPGHLPRSGRSAHHTEGRTIKLLFRRAGVLVAGAALFRVTAGLTVKKATVEELTASSQIIVHARVESSGARWEGSNIYTYTDLEVIESVKGASPDRVTVKQLGGKVGEEALEVAGTPALKPGEEVVLFLVRWNDAYWIHSIVLGKFTVERAEGRAVAVNDLNNVGLIDPATGIEITDPAGKRNALPLDQLKRQVRSAVQE